MLSKFNINQVLFETLDALYTIDDVNVPKALDVLCALAESHEIIESFRVELWRALDALVGLSESSTPLCNPYVPAKAASIRQET